MSDFPGGTQIVLEGRTEKEGVDLVMMGYKYNKSKVLVFVMMKGVASTKAGKPYKAKFPNRFGNVCVFHVTRPMMVVTFFGKSNEIDSWNHLCQFELALEKKWVTQDGYFRLYTTMMGCTAACTYKMHPLVFGSSPSSILSMVDELSATMVDKANKLEIV